MRCGLAVLVVNQPSQGVRAGHGARNPKALDMRTAHLMQAGLLAERLDTFGEDINLQLTG